MIARATNRYCEALGIAVPRLELAAKSTDANFYSLLIAALLEQGGPLTLAEVAGRFERAGIAPAKSVLASLKRCKPARPPVYRDGDRYALDPHDDECDLWAFRLGLRPPRQSPAPAPPPPEPTPLATSEERLSVGELDEVLRRGAPSGWSALRIAILVLDAHGGAMRAEDAVAFVRARTQWSPLRSDDAQYWRRGSPIRVRDDGMWELDAGHGTISTVRRALRERLALVRRWDRPDLSPEMIQARDREVEARRAAHAAQLAVLRRVILHGFPPEEPRALVMLDVGRHEIATFVGAELARAGQMAEAFDVLVGLNLRRLAGRLGLDLEGRRLAELSPPQKTLTIDGRRRTLKITTEMLIGGSCGIGRSLGEPARMQHYLDNGEMGKLRRRLEADAKSLFALYEYGRLHHAVRMRWGFVDTMFPVPWAHRDEPSLGSLMRQAHEAACPLEIIVGSAPGWEAPWARSVIARVLKEEDGWRSWLIGVDGRSILTEDVRRARMVVAPESPGS